MDFTSSSSFLHVLIVSSFICFTFVAAAERKEDPKFWNEQAQSRLYSILNRKANTNIAKNVILFLGDGMGVTTVTAGRILKGQLKGNTGEEEDLVFDTFPHSALVKTYNVDRQTSDSAGTATAFLCGIKANAGTVGLDNSALRGNCTQQKGAEVDSILKWSQAAGKSVGIVTNTRITHATPAASYAHSSERDWEGDAQMSGVTGCKDIAYQLISDNKNIQVILGGGRRAFTPVEQGDPITGTNDTTNNRRDGRNLIQAWITDKTSNKKRYQVLYNNTDVKNVDVNSVDYVLGLFATSHMSYDLERHGTDEPSLSEMTALAIKILKKNPKGFFLLVEGGRIDHAHHDSQAKKSLYEVVAFDTAVQEGIDSTSEKDTLVVVTADHSHAFVMGGYPTRGNDILGLTDTFGKDPNDPPSDGKPSTTLLYGNGPGHNAKGPRQNLTGINIHDNDYIQQSAVPMVYETHGGEDVAVYARGPMAHLFQGVQEQNYIPHVMAYASCVGVNKKHCDPKEPSNSQSVTVSRIVFILLTILSSLFIY